MTRLEIENDSLESGDEVEISPFDEHIEHIHSHKNILVDPINFNNPQVIARVLNHIQEHINALKDI